MTTIIRKLPLSEVRTSIRVPDGTTVPILPMQIVLSVSIAPNDVLTLPSQTPIFPAVLDTGFNRAFLLQEQHLMAWAGLRREQLTQVGIIHAYGKPSPLYAANVWLHPNKPGERAIALNRKPFCVYLDPGIGVCPRRVTQPRLPLLGLPTLMFGDLQIVFHWRRKAVSLRTTSWWSRLFE
jgi:hypothetical protein